MSWLDEEIKKLMAAAAGKATPAASKIDPTAGLKDELLTMKPLPRTLPKVKSSKQARDGPKNGHKARPGSVSGAQPRPRSRARPPGVTALGFARAEGFKSTVAELQPGTTLHKQHQALRKIWGPRRALMCGADVGAVHVYKAAGSFAEAVMTDLCGASSFAELWFWDGARDRRVRGVWVRNMSASVEQRGGQLLSLVRDPVDRAMSVLHEMVRRGWMRKGATLRSLSDRLCSQGFFNDHAFPQSAHLLAPSSGKALPLTYLGRAESASSELVPLLSWALNVQAPATLATKARSSRGVTRHSSVSSTEAVLPSWNETRALCQHYRIDYHLLQLPLPRACSDLEPTFNPCRIVN